MLENPITEEGKNCWRRAEARRVRFLVDAEEYFAAFADAAENARQQIIVVGWDLHSKTVLRRNRDTGEPVDRLEDFLHGLTSGNRALRIYLLQWDFAMIYLLERELLPLFPPGWQTHRHVRHKLDDRHPVGASHHQKIVVIDDRLAFVGGLDLTAERWDTREHKAEDSRRTNPDGDSYAPFHDVQVALEGRVAGVLGDLARTRWQRATGRRLPVPKVAESPWPSNWHPDLENVVAAVARTEPEQQDLPEVREVEQLFLNAIAAARNCIYLENQYITSNKITDALAGRLREDNPPQIVLLTRLTSGNWMEEATMDVLRARVINKLRQADHAGKLRVFFPVALAGDLEVKKVIHSKVSVIDDVMLRIGSANLSNRSMGLDTECDVAFEGEGKAEVAEAITAFRNDLLAEHCNVARAELEQAIERRGSLIAALDSLSGKNLRPLDEKVGELLDAVIPESTMVDPEEPLEVERIVARTLAENRGEARQRPILRLAAAGVLLLILAAVWRWSPLNQWLDPEYLAALTIPFTESNLGPLYILVVFVAGGLLVIPVTALILITALLFPPWAAFIYSLAGILASAAVGYFVGSHLWRETVSRIAGRRINNINVYLEKRGIMMVILLRNVPVAPFTIFNMVAGSSGVSFRDYLAGTLLGMAPGALALTVFADRLKAIVSNPDIYSILAAGGVIGLIVAGSLAFKRFAEVRRKKMDGV